MPRFYLDVVEDGVCLADSDGMMAEQLDVMGGNQLRQKIESMGVQVHTAKNTKEISQGGQFARKTMAFADGSSLEVDFIVFSTGIRPQDKLARQCDLEIAPRGGIVINDQCQTSDADVYAIGECASWNQRTFGLVAPGYKMAQVTADHLLGRENQFTGADMSAKLKLLGVDVAGIGDAHARTEGARSYLYLDESKALYKRLVVSEDNTTLLGAVLVGDTSDYGNLLQLVLNSIPLPENPDALILPAWTSRPHAALLPRRGDHDGPMGSSRRARRSNTESSVTPTVSSSSSARSYPKPSWSGTWASLDSAIGFPASTTISRNARAG